MRKVLIFMIVISMITIHCSIDVWANGNWPTDVYIEAEAGIVIDMDTGAVLYGKNTQKTYPPASIVKLLTALIVIENCENLEEMIIFSEDAVNNVESGSGNKIDVIPGDQLSVNDCLYALLLRSCNQAANALAEHIAGSRDSFVAMMNQKAVSLGCSSSHFANPSGLNDTTQYVTALDMAYIAQAAFSNEKLLEINKTLSYKIAPLTKHPDGLTLNMEHKLLKTQEKSSPYYCPTAKAGKTGFTKKAGSTLVTYAEQEGLRLISIILKGSPSQYYLDSKALLNFGFENFRKLKAPSLSKILQDQEEINLDGNLYSITELDMNTDSYLTLPKDTNSMNLQWDIPNGLPSNAPNNAIALIQYTWDGHFVGISYIIQKDLPTPTQPNIETPSNVKNPSNLTKIIFLVIVVLFISIGLTFLCYYRKRRSK